MFRSATFQLAFTLVAAWPLFANTANGDPRLERLYSQFIAPCCWQETLLLHHSPKADELRSEIKQLVAAGQSDEQIKGVLVGQYTRRILSEPEGALGQWLSWTPVAVTIVGLGAVVFAIRRLRAFPTPAPASGLAPLPPDAEWDVWPEAHEPREARQTSGDKKHS